MKLYEICPYLFQCATRPIVRTVLNFFCDLEVKGLENLKEADNNFILAGNHQHELDGFLVPATIPLSVFFQPLFPVSREKEFYRDKGLRGKLLYGGLFFKLMGAYPAFSGLKNYKKSLQNQLDILSDDHSILIFPQGKASKQTDPGKIKGGLGYLAIHTDHPVIPVEIEGIHGMNLMDFMLRRRKMKIVFHPPVNVNSEFENRDNVSKYTVAAKKIMSDLWQKN